MASIGEIMAEVTHAEVVTHETMVMYDDELLTDIKCLTVEELYVRLDKELANLDGNSFHSELPSNPKEEDRHKGRMKQLVNKHLILGYLSELYRRNVSSHLNIHSDWWKLDEIRCNDNRKETSCRGRLMEPDEVRHSNICCAKCRTDREPLLSKQESMDLHEHTVSEKYWATFSGIKSTVKDDLNKLRKIKEIQLASLIQPRMYQEINDLMDSILDANGNKISEFKEYLTPEHYRLIRSGIDVKEIKELDVLLASLRKMKLKGK
jgi:hypothetical protein